MPEMTDQICIKTMTVALMMPTTVEEDGKSVVLDDADIEERAAALVLEVDELNFPELIKTVGQSIAEENFLKYHPVVEVTSE